jgi:Sel1 repeat
VLRLFWKIAIPVACVAAIGGAAAVWWVYKAKTNERKLAEEARVCLQHAEQGDAKSESDLCNRYHQGLGVPQNYTEAARWCRKAAEQGDAKAEYGLGYLYYHGQVVTQDYAEAGRWFSKAADQGNINAQDELGYMYLKGLGVQQDDAEAFRLRREAADRGDAKAQYGIGNMYYYGQGVAKNTGEAALWYRNAANQGYATAESGMGFLAYYGYGVPLDRAEANRWFRKAADQGDEYALRTLSENLTASRKLFLWAKLIFGVWLSLSFLSLNSFESSKSLREFRQRAKTGTGLLCIFSAGLGWYGYTHYQIRCVNCGFNAFTWFYWLLGGVLLALLFYIVRSGKKIGEDRDEVGESDPLAGS